MALDEIENVFKVKLNHPQIRSERVVFHVTPDVSESRNVNYSAVEPVHSPGQIFVYRNTSARVFNINARFISRNRQEATRNLVMLNYLRSWTMPRFGDSSTLTDDQRRNRNERQFGDTETENPEVSRQRLYGTELLGAPPQLLHFSAYSTVPTNQTSESKRQMEHIKKIPVVIQQLTIPYPSDVDYIPTTEETNNVPMPTVMALDMVLNETHSPGEYERFNLDSFKRGILPGF